jgi:hypothetical protein
VATLTGAVTVALGRYVTGLLGQPQEWIRGVAAMADVAGDRVWQLPIYEEAKEQLRSEIADIINSRAGPEEPSRRRLFCVSSRATGRGRISTSPARHGRRPRNRISPREPRASR